MPDGATRPAGRRYSAKDIARRLERLEEIVGLEAEIVRSGLDQAQAAGVPGGLPLRLASMLAGRDLARDFREAAQVRTNAASVSLDRLDSAASALRRARTSLRNAEAAGADAALLVHGLDGFWPVDGQDDRPDPERLMTVSAVISSRAAAHAAAEKAKLKVVAEVHSTLETARSERDLAERTAVRTLRDGAFGEMADRSRMLLGVPGLGGMPGGRPRWPVPLPQFPARDEKLARQRHREGAEFFSEILAGGYPGNTNPPAAEWPPTEEALRTLALSRAQGRKIARPRSAELDPTDRWRFPDVRWEDKDHIHRVAPEAASAFAEDFPGRVPLLASLPGRTALASLPFMPIPRSASSLNMRTHFTSATWDAVAGNLVAMRGERCSICGALSGQMNRNGWFGEIKDRRTGSAVPLANRAVDVHESWEFKVRQDGLGVARLVSLLVVCADCHVTFHVDQLLRGAEEFADRTGCNAAECRDAAVNYVLDRRGTMLEGVAGQPHAAADFLISAEADLSVRMSGDVATGKWIMDLSGMRLLNLAGGDPVLRPGSDPALVAGLDVISHDGSHHPATGVDARAAQVASAPAKAAVSAPEAYQSQRIASL